MSIFKKARKKLEVHLTRLGLVVFPRLPRKMILALARMTGYCAFLLARGQRMITMANLELAFGGRKTFAEKKRIAIRSFQIMALVFIDFLWFSRHTRERVREYVIMDESVPRNMPPPPAVVVTAHFGNWELMSRAFTAHDYRHVAIAAPLANPEVEAMFSAFRAAGDAEIVPMRGSLRAIRDGLLVAILLDQNTKPENGGTFVDFFGLPCPMSTIAAVLAERKNVPIVPVFCRSQRDGYYTFYTLEQFGNLPAAGSADFAQRVTQQIAATFQREIEKHPEQWVWMYKRWKHVKPDWTAGGYPWYAKPLKKT